MRNIGVVGVVCLIAFVALGSSCRSGRGSLQPPAHCEEAEEYKLLDDYATGVLLMCDPPETREEWAVCARIDYLEARCSGVNAYRSKLLEAR